MASNLTAKSLARRYQPLRLRFASFISKGDATVCLEMNRLGLLAMRKLPALRVKVYPVLI